METQQVDYCFLCSFAKKNGFIQLLFNNFRIVRNLWTPPNIKATQQHNLELFFGNYIEHDSKKTLRSFDVSHTYIF